MVRRPLGVRGRRPAGPGGWRGVGNPRAGSAPAPSPASAPPRRARRRPAARRDPRPRLSAAHVPLPGALRPALQQSALRRPRALSGLSGTGLPLPGALTSLLRVSAQSSAPRSGRSPLRPKGTRFRNRSAARRPLRGTGFPQRLRAVRFCAIRSPA